MYGSYNLTLVLASYCVAVIAAYTALYFGSHLFGMTDPVPRFWLWGGAPGGVMVAVWDSIARKWC